MRSNQAPSCAKHFILIKCINTAILHTETVSRGRLHKLQNTTSRVVCALRRYDRMSSCREEVHLFGNESRMQDTDVLYYRPQGPCNRRGPILPGEASIPGSPYVTRQNKRLHFPRITLELGRKSFSFIGPDL